MARQEILGSVLSGRYASIQLILVGQPAEPPHHLPHLAILQLLYIRICMRPHSVGRGRRLGMINALTNSVPVLICTTA